MKLIRNTLQLPDDFGALPYALRFVSLVLFFQHLGWAFVLPFFSFYVNQQLASYTAVGFVLGLLYFLRIFWSIPVGSFLDKVSIGKLLPWLFFLYLPVSYWLLSLTSLSGFVIFIIYLSLVGSLLLAALDVYVRKHAPRNHFAEASGLADSAVALAYVLGGTTASLLFAWLGFHLFWSVLIGAVIAGLLAFKLPREQGGTIKEGLQALWKEGFYWQELKHLAHAKQLKRFLLLPFLFSALHASLFLFLPLIAHALGLSALLMGLVWAFFMLPGFFEFLFAEMAELSRHHKSFLQHALIIVTGLLLVLFFIESTIALFLLVTLVGFGLAAVRPLLEAFQTEATPHERFAELTGIVNAVKYTGLAVGPLVAGFVSDLYGTSSIFLFCCVLAGLLLLGTKLLPSS